MGSYNPGVLHTSRHTLQRRVEIDTATGGAGVSNLNHLLAPLVEGEPSRIDIKRKALSFPFPIKLTKGEVDGEWLLEEVSNAEACEAT